MKILFEHSGVLPVQKYGGTERIIYWLMKELVQLGHKVYLLGHPVSQVSKIGVILIKKILGQTDWRAQIPKDVDLIHLFYTPSFELPKPVLVTIEGNGKVNERFHLNTLFISKRHAEIHGSTHFVYNGIDLEEYPLNNLEKKVGRKKWSDFLFLAKAGWKVKNLRDCIRACKKVKKNLHIAGGRVWSFSTNIYSYGMVGQKEKLKLLEQADALLFPVKWEEPFGIAIIEAFAMGLPVIGSAYGSLPELIRPNTGIICRSYKEFEESLNEKNKFDPHEIRSYVEEFFSSHLMAKKYQPYYQLVASGASIHKSQPCYQFQSSAEEIGLF